MLTDTYGSASVQLEGTQGTITLRRTPETAAWDADYGIRLEQDRTYPILGIYNEYIDLCIGELGASFHPVVYLLTKDGVVEYVDVLHCLMFGSALVCQDPIYIANNGVALERSGREVNLRREDGSVLELAPLTAEWNAQEIPRRLSVPSTTCQTTSLTGWTWKAMVPSRWACRTTTFSIRLRRLSGRGAGGHGAGRLYQRDGRGMPGITFVAAVKYDLYNETLSFTMIDGQNPFAEERPSCS